MTGAALRADVAAALQASEQALRRNDPKTSLDAARQAERLQPRHPAVLRQLAAALSATGASMEALTAIDTALALLPDDVALLTTRAIVHESAGRTDAALADLQKAYQGTASAGTAFNYGRALSKYGDEEAALTVLQRAIALDPAPRASHAIRADLLRRLGRSHEAADVLRMLVGRDARDTMAWWLLSTLDPAFSDADLHTLDRILRDTSLDVGTRCYAGFALGRADEARGQWAAAYTAIAQSNAFVRAHLAWDRMRFSAQVDEILQACATVPDLDVARGDGIVFIVSLPRAGSTLTEQVLAAHPSVGAGGERSDLFDVLAAESRRRGQPLARWVTQATAAEWESLGNAYLARAARWRGAHRVATDKMPDNWLWVGVAAAMLPGARFIDCRRDILDTAWSVYAHIFAGTAQAFSYDVDSIAAYVNDFERAMTHWQQRFPRRIRTQLHAALVDDTDAQVRALLDFVGLPFDAACLNPHEATRSVRTASASQVREPMRRRGSRAAQYGALLDPLRSALGLPLFEG